jgi:hypothetical protein
MAKSKEKGAEKEASGGKSKTVPAVIVAVALLGAGYMLGPGKARRSRPPRPGRRPPRPSWGRSPASTPSR